MARGGLFAINGVRLAGSGATRVAILHAGARLSVNVIAVQPRRIEARMPLDAPLGESSLLVETDGQPSKPFAIQVVPSNPGLFSLNGEGWGPGRADNLDSQDHLTPNSFERPAKPGQRLRFFSTGLGAGSATRVVIGNRSVWGAVHHGQRLGEEQITVRIPSGVQEGCYVPLYLDLPPARASNVITVAIGSHPGRCDSGPVPLFNEERSVAVILSRTRMRDSDSQNMIEDHALATFAHKDNRPALSPLLLLPPLGTCTAYTSSFQADPVLPTSISVALVSDMGGSGLDAGPHLVLARNGQSRTIPRIPAEPGWYKGSLNSRRPIAALGPFLEPGDFLMSGRGGKDLGAFQFTVKGPEPLEWTDAAEHAAIDRRMPLTVHWRAEPSKRVVVILATNVGQITTAVGTCLCTAPASIGHFTVPAALLTNIPASVDIPGIPYDRLFLAVLPPHATPIAIQGLNGGAAMGIYAEGRIVSYR